MLTQAGKVTPSTNEEMIISLQLWYNEAVGTRCSLSKQELIKLQSGYAVLSSTQRTDIPVHPREDQPIT